MNKNFPHRVQIYEWKTGKVIPKPKTIKKIEDEKIRKEMALIAISHYLPFLDKKDIKTFLKQTKTL